MSAFLVGCNQQPQQVATTEPYANNANIAMPEELPLEERDDYWAKDNFDLARVGNVLERSKSAEEVETYLNEPGGINNLDLNGDGYVDYISVDEYRDVNDYERGLSFYTRFGPSEVQEIGTVVLYRDEPSYPGARFLVTGNPQIYGDNFYYETNWLDRSLAIATALFSPRVTYYQSPYYYDYYPPGYTVYGVVERPIYYSRIETLYPQPMFVFTTAPTFIDRIKIKSPNNGLHLGWTKARFAKPTKEQAEFFRNNRGNPRAAKAEKGNKGNPAVDSGKFDDKGGRRENASKGVRQNDGVKMQKVNETPGRGNNRGGKPQNTDKGGNSGGKGKGKKP